MSRLIRLFSACTVSTIALGALTGCGVGAADTTQSPIIAPAINGRSMGGNAPIVGATIKIYATGVTPGDGTSTNTGYGVGTQIAEAQTIAGQSAGWDTDTSGSFSFAGGYDCPAGQFAYLVSSGGNPGGGINPNAVTVAALGRCEDLYTFAGGVYTGYKGTNIIVNELTTVAAAYALGQFSSEVGSGAATQVLIGAPATNNAVSGSASTTAVSGLAHAFQNSLNLVNPTSSGYTANSTLPGNSGAVVPQALIHAIANTIVACVNSPGGTAGDSSACGKIFTATTIGTSVPVDTWGALVNLAANPTLGGSGTAVANFFNLATAQTSAYSPTLTATTNLNDFSIAISYPSGMTVGSSSVLFPTSGALDINDNYYAANQAAASSGNMNVISIASNGTPNGASAVNTTLAHGLGFSLDAIGNGYFVNGSGSGTSVIGAFTYSSAGVPSAITVKSGSSGNTLKAFNSAVDIHNNLWLVGTATSATTVNECAAGGGSCVGIATPVVGVPGGNEVGIGIDPDQNVWISANTTSTTTLSVVPNTNTVVSPNYSSTVVTATTGGKPSTGVTFAPGSPFTAYVSSYNTTPGIQPFVPTLGGTSNVTVTAMTPGTFTASTISGTFFNEADGAGTIWLADTNAHAMGQYNPTSAVNYRILPCYVSAGICTAAGSVSKPIYVSIDSAGSVWAIYQGAPTQIVQVIGSAAPTWPLLSLGKLGKP